MSGMSVTGAEAVLDPDGGFATMLRDEVVAPDGRFDTGILGRLFDAMPILRRKASSWTLVFKPGPINWISSNTHSASLCNQAKCTGHWYRLIP